MAPPAKAKNENVRLEERFPDRSEIAPPNAGPAICPKAKTTVKNVIDAPREAGGRNPRIMAVTAAGTFRKAKPKTKAEIVWPEWSW